MRERDFDIDCLRSVMIALVVLHHTAITYGASGLWAYKELPSSGTPSSVILTLFTANNQAYFMGFLFLLAGYFTPGSLERKGYARFLSDRFLQGISWSCLEQRRVAESAPPEYLEHRNLLCGVGAANSACSVAEWLVQIKLRAAEIW